MAKQDPRIDAYIAKAGAFARPILAELRRRVHRGAPDTIETIKWNAPFFLIGTEPIASMAAFKAHTKFLVWAQGGFRHKPTGADFTSVEALPPAAEHVRLVAEAVAALASGAASKPVAKKAASKKPASKKPTSKKPAAKKPVAKKPARRKT